jgi:hypothetical protein
MGLFCPWYNSDMSGTVPILTSPAVKQVAERKARRQGLSVGEYVRRLILADDKDPWGPVPQAVWEEWDREVAAFEEEDRKHPRPRFTSGADYVEYIRRKT